MSADDAYLIVLDVCRNHNYVYGIAFGHKQDNSFCLKLNKTFYIHVYYVKNTVDSRSLKVNDNSLPII